VLSEDIRPAETAAACCAELASASGATGMVGGQVADLEAETSAVSTVEELEAIHRRKTGRLFSASLRMGAQIGQADADTFKAIDIFGKHVGLAFQIADDVLDVCGDSAKMGKGTQKDADHGKSTYPSLVGETKSREMARNLIDKARRSIAGLGKQGQRLDQLAEFVLQRDH